MTASVRTHLESLVLGTAGTTRVMDGRFQKCAPDCTPETHPADSCERRFQWVIPAPSPLHPINPLSGRKWLVHKTVLRIAYARTNAGGDAAESVQPEQDGPGTLDAIRDRITTDATDLESVLVYHLNRAGTDPVICLLHPEGEPREIVLPDRVISELPYSMTTQTSLPSFYAP